MFCVGIIFGLNITPTARNDSPFLMKDFGWPYVAVQIQSVTIDQNTMDTISEVKRLTRPEILQKLQHERLNPNAEVIDCGDAGVIVNGRPRIVSLYLLGIDVFIGVLITSVITSILEYLNKRREDKRAALSSPPNDAE
jgi:hypothetical protein